METDYKSTTYPKITLGEWIITFIITMIPILNIIMLFVWGFSSSTNPSKANWAKAALILILVWIIFGIIFGSYFAHWFYQSYPNTY